MRLATWNCCRGPLEKKAGLLDAFGADISVIQECARPKAESDSLLWFGDNPRQGLAVVARGDYRLKRVRRARSVPKYVVPVEVIGPQPVHLDYCFIPKAWLPGLRSVAVEPYEPWKSHSDHRPAIVDAD